MPRKQFNKSGGSDEGYSSKNVNFQFQQKKEKLGILSEDVMSYYRNVSSTLESDFDDETLKDNFLTNVYTTLKDEGILVSQNQTVSRILEQLFSHSKPSHMQDLFCRFCEELTIVAFDRFASHVFQALIQYMPAIYEAKEESNLSDQTRNIHASIEKLCKFMESHMIDVMTHTYASHVLRALFEALGGVRVKEEIMRSRGSRTQSKTNADSSHSADSSCKALSRDFQAPFVTLKEKLLRLCNFEDHLMDANFCPLLQTVLLILHKTSSSEYESLVQTITQKTLLTISNEETDIDDVAKRLPDIVQNEVGSYLIDLLISLASDVQLRQLYDQLFSNKLIYFAVHPIANYVLQKLLTTVRTKGMMEELLNDTCQYLEDILAVNHVGIVTKLAEACRRTGNGQEKFLMTLMKAFHCQEPEERKIKVVPLLASMQTYEIFFHLKDPDKKTSHEETSKHLLKTTNIHGSLLLQQLIQFSHPELVVSSLLALSPAELVGLCCDKCGSHVIDVFFQSLTVLEKNKYACLEKLKGMFVNIACNRNGSRCLESIWKGSSLKQRLMITEDLAKSQDRLEGDQWGRFLYNNFALAKFSQRRQEWMEIQGSSTKKQKIVRDILEGKSKKKKRQKHLTDQAENEVVDQVPLSSSSGKSSTTNANQTSTETMQPSLRQQSSVISPVKKSKLKTDDGSAVNLCSFGQESDRKSSKRSKKLNVYESLTVDRTKDKQSVEQPKKKKTKLNAEDDSAAYGTNNEQSAGKPKKKKSRMSVDDCSEVYSPKGQEAVEKGQKKKHDGCAKLSESESDCLATAAVSTGKKRKRNKGKKRSIRNKASDS